MEIMPFPKPMWLHTHTLVMSYFSCDFKLESLAYIIHVQYLLGIHTASVRTTAISDNIGT